MVDIEFLSSLIIVTIDGIIRDTPKIIDNYYKKYDADFDDSEEIESRFTTTMRLLVTIFEKILLPNTFTEKIISTHCFVYCLIRYMVFRTLTVAEMMSSV